MLPKIPSMAGSESQGLYLKKAIQETAAMRDMNELSCQGLIDRASRISDFLCANNEQIFSLTDPDKCEFAKALYDVEKNVKESRELAKSYLIAGVSPEEVLDLAMTIFERPKNWPIKARRVSRRLSDAEAYIQKIQPNSTEERAGKLVCQINQTRNADKINQLFEGNVQDCIDQLRKMQSDLQTRQWSCQVL